MSTRITVDLQDPQLLKLLKWEAAQKAQNIREIVVAALENYFSEKKENRAVLKLADKAFAEWENEDDAVYDDL